MAGFEPCREDRIPPLVVGARRQLRDIVDGAVGLDPAQLAKVIDGVTAIGRAAPNPEQKQAALALSQPIEFRRQSLDRSE